MSSRDRGAVTGVGTPADAAEAAAEAIRTVNHLTLVPPSSTAPGWSDVGDIYRLLGELRVVADRLPQVCDQIVSGLQALGDRGDWFADEGTTRYPDEVVGTAVEELQVASCVADDFGRCVQRAHCAVAHLYQ